MHIMCVLEAFPWKAHCSALHDCTTRVSTLVLSVQMTHVEMQYDLHLLDWSNSLAKNCQSKNHVNLVYVSQHLKHMPVENNQSCCARAGKLLACKFFL